MANFSNFLDVRGAGELLPYKGNHYLWHYVPSLVVGGISFTVFLMLSLAHTWKMFRTRLWFCLPFVIGGYLEVVGFVGRIAAHYATERLMPYVLQSLFLLVPPSLFAASIYMTLGRIIKGLGPRAESCCLIRVKWLTTLFVVGDVFAFFIQSGGAGMMASGGDAKMGENIVIGGLLFQILFFGLFVTVAVVFDRRFRIYNEVQGAFGGSSHHLQGDYGEASPATFDWHRLLQMLYATSALILVRCIFRIVEYTMGHDGYLLQNEWTVYVFDSLLMALTMVLFYWRYPSEIPSFTKLSMAEEIDLSYQGGM